MTSARVRAFGAAVLIILVAALAYAQLRRAPAPAERPTLLLLTSLPLTFGEDFSTQGNGSPTLNALQARYRVVPISVADPRELAKGRLLLMAQPRAQRAEDLVALDDWVRGGGRLLLLADPMLEWPSKLPLGDPLRPPIMFADTGLLAHWGLRLDGPDQRGPKAADIGGHRAVTLSPGQLVGTCPVSSDGIVARCRVGRGAATVISDADFLDVEELGSAGAQNLDGLVDELERLG